MVSNWGFNLQVIIEKGAIGITSKRLKGGLFKVYIMKVLFSQTVDEVDLLRCIVDSLDKRRCLTTHSSCICRYV